MRGDSGDDSIDFGGGGSFSDNDHGDDGNTSYTPAERHFIAKDQTVKMLIVLCRGMKDGSVEDVIDLDKAPWNTILDRKEKPVKAKSSVDGWLPIPVPTSLVLAQLGGTCKNALNGLMKTPSRILERLHT